MVVAELDDVTKDRLLDDIDADLALSAAALPLLSVGPRRAVALAHTLFEALARRIRATPAGVLQTTRISVPTTLKLLLALRVMLGYVPRSPRSARKVSHV